MSGGVDTDGSGVGIARMRAAAGIDVGAGVLLAVLLYPFPIMRAALPLASFVLSILAASALVVVIAAFLSVLLGGRTAGMYLMDLELSGRPGAARLLLWALGWTGAFLPALVVPHALDPVRGWHARISGVPVVRAGRGE